MLTERIGVVEKLSNLNCFYPLKRNKIKFWYEKNVKEIKSNVYNDIYTTDYTSELNVNIIFTLFFYFFSYWNLRPNQYIQLFFVSFSCIFQPYYFTISFYDWLSELWQSTVLCVHVNVYNTRTWLWGLCFQCIYILYSFFIFILFSIEYMHMVWRWDFKGVVIWWILYNKYTKEAKCMKKK